MCVTTHLTVCSETLIIITCRLWVIIKKNKFSLTLTFLSIFIHSWRLTWAKVLLVYHRIRQFKKPKSLPRPGIPFFPRPLISKLFHLLKLNSTLTFSIKLALIFFPRLILLLFILPYPVRSPVSSCNTSSC